MSSPREALIEALDAIDAGYAAVAGYPVETLSRTEGHALLTRLDKLEQKAGLLRRRLSGRLIAVTRERRMPA
ncbi:hypothetical protein [Mycolicibacterium sp. XJ1819]